MVRTYLVLMGAIAVAIWSGFSLGRAHRDTCPALEQFINLDMKAAR